MLNPEFLTHSITGPIRLVRLPAYGFEYTSPVGSLLEQGVFYPNVG